MAAAHQVKGLFMKCDHTRRDELAQIGDLVARGHVQVHVDTVLALEDARKAQELQQQQITRKPYFSLGARQ